MTDEEFITRSRMYCIARANPEHKLRIVRKLKAHGEVVALTGDGVTVLRPSRQRMWHFDGPDGIDVARSLRYGSRR